MATDISKRLSLRLLVRLGVGLAALWLLALGAWFVPGLSDALGGRVAVALVGIGYASALGAVASLAAAALWAGARCLRRGTSRRAI